MRLYLLLFIISSSILFACKEESTPPFDSESTDRVVLVEEFTGVRCPNCPKGAEALMDLKNKFGDNLVVVALHTSFLGSPFTDSKFNFLTDEAEEIEAYLGPRGKPNIAINRVQFENEESITITYGNKWESRIDSRLETQSSVYINIDNEFIHSERKLTSVITIDPQNDLNGKHSLTVYITESGIVDLQAESGTNPNYVHNHVFRTVLTNTLGDDLPDNLITNQPIERTFEFIFPDEEGWWIPENCNVVAFVSNTNNKRVLQAGEAVVID